MSGSLGPWADARLTASWRGIPFVVRESAIKRGRRQAVHEYVMRDDVWVEDLGRGTQITSFRGFIVGDAVDALLQALILAAETPGPGVMVHPALGPMVGNVVEFDARDSAERGRVWELDFVFISATAREFPGAEADTQGDVDDAADEAEEAVDDDFGEEGGFFQDLLDGVGSAVQAVGDVAAAAAQAAEGVLDTVGEFVGLAQQVVGDAQMLGNAAVGIVGNYGRFSLGARLATIPGVSNAAAAVALAGFAAGAVGDLADQVAQAAADL